MRYKIKYCVACHKGNVREINQDNFYANGTYLDLDNTGLDTLICKTVAAQSNPILAVFDGMGGEQKGEVASFTAAKVLQSLHFVEAKQNGIEYFQKTCAKINREICKYAEQEHLSTAGTTGAFILFGKKEIFICNIGDSPIFRFENGEIQQISTDHIQENYLNGKPPLTQFLGVPENDFIIDPYIAKGSYKAGNKYLLCSDGLTDMVGIDAIRQTVISSNIENAVLKLQNIALDNGGKDNITIVLCEIQKEKLIRLFGKGDNHEH